jgi:hypothetical protein
MFFGSAQACRMPAAKSSAGREATSTPSAWTESEVVSRKPIAARKLAKAVGADPARVKSVIEARL